MTSNMIYIVALGVGFKCPRKIHLNTQCPPPYSWNRVHCQNCGGRGVPVPTALQEKSVFIAFIVNDILGHWFLKQNLKSP